MVLRAMDARADQWTRPTAAALHCQRNPGCAGAPRRTHHAWRSAPVLAVGWPRAAGCSRLAWLRWAALASFDAPGAAPWRHFSGACFSPCALASARRGPRQGSWVRRAALCGLAEATAASSDARSSRSTCSDMALGSGGSDRERRCSAGAGAVRPKRWLGRSWAAAPAAHPTGTSTQPGRGGGWVRVREWLLPEGPSHVSAPGELCVGDRLLGRAAA